MTQAIEPADRIRELLDRNLQEVFGESDAARRRAAIDELWTEDAVLYVPPGAITGLEAISGFAGALRAKSRTKTSCALIVMLPVLTIEPMSQSSRTSS
jgi:hypothetical protein